MQDFPLTTGHILGRMRRIYPDSEVVTLRSPGTTTRASYAEVADRAERLSAALASLGVQPGDRVLFDVRLYPDPTDWLLAPLFAGASIVLCAGLDKARLDARVTAEKVTVTLVD